MLNDLHAHGKIISERELNMKILRTLPRSWQSKVDAIQEGNDLATLSYDKPRGKLLAYERTYMRESLNLKKKKNVAFQTSHKIEEEDDKDLDFETKSQDNEMALVVRKFLNMYRKRGKFKGRQPPKREQNKGY